MALYNDETAGKSLQKVFNRIGIRRSLNLGDLSSTKTSLSNLLNGLVRGDGNFIAEDLNAIKNIFSNGLTNSGYRNVIGSAAIFTNIDGDTNFFDPRITYQNRLDITEVFTGNPRFLGGNGLTANYFQNDQILFDEHDDLAGIGTGFEYNVDPNTTEAEVFGGVTADGRIPPDNFWEEGDFEYSAKVHPQSSKINTGVKWEGYFVPRRTGPVRFRIRCTGYFTFDFNQEGYEEDNDKNIISSGIGTYKEHMRIGISTEIPNIAGLANQNTIFLSAAALGQSAVLEKMNTIGIGMTAVHDNIAIGSKVFDFDKNTGTIELTPPEGAVSAVTGLLDGTATVKFTRHLGDEIEHSIDTHVLKEYKKNRIRMSYFHHKNFDSKDIDRIFNIDIKEMDIATHQDFRYNRLFALDYDFSDEAKGDFSKYYDSSIRFGGTGSLDSPTIGSTNNSDNYVKLTTTSKIVVEYEPPKKLENVVIKTFEVKNTQGTYAPSNRETGSHGVIVTADSPILTLRTKEKTQGVEIGNLIVSTQATGDDQGGQGSQGGDGEPSIPFFARVEDFVINNYIVMDMNALPATGANIGIGVTKAAQVKIIDHRGLVRRVRVKASNSDLIESSVATNPFTGTQSANSSSRTAYKDVQKGMIVVGEGTIPDYTVVDEVISKTELKLSAPVTVSANQDVFFYDSKGLRDNSTLAYCDRFNTTPSGPDVRCLIAKVKNQDGTPVAGGHQPGTTSFEVEDDNGVASGWTLQGIYFGDSGTAVTNVVEVGTASTTITIASGIKAPLLDGTRFTAVNSPAPPDRTLCCPPTDTSPPFRATAEGLNTVKNEYENLKIDGGNLVFESLILQDNVNNNTPNNTSSINGNTVEANRKIKIKSTTENKSYHILAVE